LAGDSECAIKIVLLLVETFAESLIGKSEGVLMVDIAIGAR
jgi:hypothetical protein